MLSKAKRLRKFWLIEPNHVVAKLTQAMVEYHPSHGFTDDDGGMLREECRRIVIRLAQGALAAELDALTPAVDEPDFEVLAKQVRDAIEKNEPEAGLDRLHTFVVKFVRACCEERSISCPQDKPLHSIFGEYVKRLRQGGQIESEMTERILKSSISVLEAFNDVRNNQSLAHDNRTLMVATSAEWGASERALRADVSADLKFVLVRGTKRATRWRTVPIVSRDQRTLLEYAVQHAKGPKDGALFLAWQNIRRDLREACERVGIEARPDERCSRRRAARRPRL
jgi:hypothetical protein